MRDALWRVLVLKGGQVCGYTATRLQHQATGPVSGVEKRKRRRNAVQREQEKSDDIVIGKNADMRYLNRATTARAGGDFDEDQANRRLEEISSTLFGVGALLKVDQRIQIVEGASTYFRRKHSLGKYLMQVLKGNMKLCFLWQPVCGPSPYSLHVRALPEQEFDNLWVELRMPRAIIQHETQRLTMHRAIIQHETQRLTMHRAAAVA
ncbi:hypothetical protein AK812_SmicGene10717 [Symbiodinium microadriaticum]|uniref:Uncharacterized protein n=1 Tax=Symbiodinium microadriaticum TaxID=2951 RepID=A0A1Q9EF43_SYMMI|nr:hypothetical protein AK812_SmicGene10717 [Symbiodinium microadriaticum]